MTSLGQAVPCFICQKALEVRLTRGKTGKPSLMLICPEDPRHFRGFIAHRPFVTEVMERLKDRS